MLKSQKANCSVFFAALTVVALVIVVSIVASTVNNSKDFKDALSQQNITLTKVDHVNPNSYSTIINVNGYDLIQIAKEHNFTVYYDKESFVPLWYYVQDGATVYNYKP